MKLHALIVLCLCELLLPLQGQAAPSVASPSLSICYMDVDKPPYWQADGTGQDLDLIRAAAAKLGIKVNLTPLPWKRCQLAVEMHRIDGMLGASFSEERRSMVQYPYTTSGAVDDGAALHMDGYYFYKKKKDPVLYDGNRLNGLTGEVGTNAGFSIVDKLAKRGMLVRDSAKSTLQTLQMLHADRYQVIVDSGARTDYYLKTNPDLLASIEKMTPAVELGGRFLVFSQEYYGQNNALAEKFWQEIRKSRERK